MSYGRMLHFLVLTVPLVSGDFAPGWNGMAKTPPMGWRSWNAFAANINQTIIASSIIALAEKRWKIDGNVVSLADLGYIEFGIDEGWEECKHGIGGSQHDAFGNPLINKSRFPDLRNLVDMGHERGLRMGWYLAGCACGEPTEEYINYEGDVRQLSRFGFDAVKLDNCGSMKNLTLYASLMRNSGKNYTIENCHWGQCWAQDGDFDASGCPTQTWCPFNIFRSSPDIGQPRFSWVRNLQTMLRFLNATAPLSRPGCWAYPDMLEVGLVDGSMEWNQAHFGAWCITSSPLILGLDLTDDQLLSRILHIIGNNEAIAVNQAWVGHPGRFVFGYGQEGTYVVGDYCDANVASQRAWSYDASAQAVRGPGGCLDLRAPPGAPDGQPQMRPCDTSSAQRFQYNSTAKVLQNGDQCLALSTWWGNNIYFTTCGSSPEKIEFTSDGSVTFPSQPAPLCFQVNPAPEYGFLVQVWAKPLPHGAVAVYVLNQNSTTQNVSLDLNSLGVEGVHSIRDIWTHKDIGKALGSFLVSVSSMSSRFLVFSPWKPQVEIFD
eukprot:TRINITY_DN71845_c0_g1_i1.p1 TRINITY_DN71845_c0_g1~~TRINITY_DN71845_c0_g1_i1.p1  ORF type:complete len:546 (+),score=51.84 TRINITY_DN71845_c0_g1_i1:91-1728(+)